LIAAGGVNIGQDEIVDWWGGFCPVTPLKARYLANIYRLHKVTIPWGYQNPIPREVTCPDCTPIEMGEGKAMEGVPQSSNLSGQIEPTIRRLIAYRILTEIDRIQHGQNLLNLS